MIINIEAPTDKQLERQEKVKRIKKYGISPDGVRRVLDVAKASNQARQERITQGILDAAANAKWPEQSAVVDSEK